MLESALRQIFAKLLVFPSPPANARYASKFMNDLVVEKRTGKMTIVVIILLILILGGGGGYYGYGRWGYGGGAGISLGTILLIVLIAYLLGVL